MKHELLFEEYRGGVLECEHFGSVCVVNENGVAASVGDPDFHCFYRSCSKPIQSLPVIARHLPEKYGLTEKETAVLSSSHWGDAEHEEACLSIMKKADLREEDMIMLPTWPNRAERKEALLRAGQTPRKIWHNCSGKHLALMMLTRELGEDVRDYWRPDGKTQEVVLQAVSALCETPENGIATGVDGCGVPVFAAPLRQLAMSFLNLSRPERIRDSSLQDAAIRNTAIIHRNPTMISGKDTVCSVLCANPDLLGKAGAQGVYCMGIRSLGLGIAAKILDGSQDEFGMLVIAILQKLGIAPETVKELETLYPAAVINDNRIEVGIRRPVFIDRLNIG